MPIISMNGFRPMQPHGGGHMKIESTQVQLGSSRVYEKKQSVSESLQAWVGERPAENTPPIQIDISKEALSLLWEPEDTITISKTEPVDEEEDVLSADDKLKLHLLESFLSAMTGKRVKLRVPHMNLKNTESGNYNKSGHPVSSAAQPSGNAGWGIIYDRRESLREYEHTDFQAKGTVTTADGREIKFAVDMHMERTYTEESSFSLRAGDALKDPLVINYGGAAAGLSNEKFSFDLDMNGTPDQISLLKSGSGFLALDNNANGKIDDGSELFGPKTDSGFGELREYDSDENAWIDENDPIFNKLRIWMKDDSGNDKLMALGEVGIGAIYLGHVSTEFTLRQLDVQGRIRDTGVFLKEDGQVGTVQELDLKI